MDDKALRVVDYSPKSVVVLGDINKASDALKGLGGLKNDRLTVDGTKVSGE